MQKRVEIRVSGRVQMVMYRDFAQRTARSLGIVGTVQNMSDGSVAISAQGNEKSLNDFIEQLHVGPVLSRVDHVYVESGGNIDSSYRDFQIKNHRA